MVTQGFQKESLGNHLNINKMKINTNLLKKVFERIIKSCITAIPALICYAIGSYKPENDVWLFVCVLTLPVTVVSIIAILYRNVGLVESIFIVIGGSFITFMAGVAAMFTYGFLGVLLIPALLSLGFCHISGEHESESKAVSCISNPSRGLYSNKGLY